MPSSPVREPTAPLGGERVEPRSAHYQFTVPPFPFAAERNGEQAPMTPDRRERPSLGHSGQGRRVGIGSLGLGAGGGD